MKTGKIKQWFNPLSDFDNDPPIKKSSEREATPTKTDPSSPQKSGFKPQVDVFDKNWMKNFDPVTVEELSVNAKKVQEVEHWMRLMTETNRAEILLLTGPVGCGKTITVQTLAAKHDFKLQEWVTPVDIEIPTEYGDYEFKERQSTKFLDFIINAANFTSLLDNNSKKIVLVEDFPHTFMRTPSEFTEVLDQYKRRAKSPIVFICSESHSDNKNTSMNLFTPHLKDQFQIQHISFNSVTATGLKAALKRVAEIMSKKYSSAYNSPSADLIECVVNSSAGDVRSAVLNLHFASLKGSNQTLETSKFMEKDKSKSKTVKKKKQLSTKFSSIGKDQTVSILHGVGRVLNPKSKPLEYNLARLSGISIDKLNHCKKTDIFSAKQFLSDYTIHLPITVIMEGDKEKLSHTPTDVIEQFTSQPSSFVSFLEENYLSHFSCIDHAQMAACALSDADLMLAEWRERLCQEYGLYVATAGLMLANRAPVSAWNPVRGPKNMNIHYPTISDLPLLDPDLLYKGKVLVSDFQSYCKIINTAIN